MNFFTRAVVRWLASALLLAGASAAQATVVAPSYEYLNPTGAANVLTGGGQATALALPGQYLFGNLFTAPQASALLGTAGTGSYGFQDTYAFTLPAAASGNVLTATLNLGDTFSIANLQVRLYGWANGSAVPLPTVGSTPGGTVNAIGWTGFQAGQNVLVLNFGVVPAGTYYLDVRGTASGQSGGSYVGLFNVTPVPLPAGLPLLLSGLGLLGFARRRDA